MKSDPNAQAHALCACTIGWVPPEGVFQPSYACQRESLRCCWFWNRHREVKWINAVHTEVKCAPLSSLIHPQGLLGVQESFVEGTNDLFFFYPLIQSWKISLWRRQWKKTYFVVLWKVWVLRKVLLRMASSALPSPHPYSSWGFQPWPPSEEPWLKPGGPPTPRVAFPLLPEWAQDLLCRQQDTEVATWYKDSSVSMLGEKENSVFRKLF